MSPGEQEDMKSRYREHRAAARSSGFGIPVADPEKSALEVSKQERDEAFQAGWDAGNLVALLLSSTK